MNKLIIFEDNMLKTLRNDFSDRNIQSFNAVYHTCQDPKNISELNLNNTVIDLTNIVSDISNNVYNRTFYELYFSELLEQFDDIIYILQKKQKENLESMYPYLFDEDNIEYRFTEEHKEEKYYIPNKRFELLSYETLHEVFEILGKESIMNFSELINGNIGINAQIDVDIIDKMKATHLDITSLVSYVQLRKDQKFIFETTIRDIVRRKNIDFIIHEDYCNDALEIFQFIFQKKRLISNAEKKHLRSARLIEPDFIENDIKLIAEKIDSLLIGHDLFKNALIDNLIKFSILNRLGRRKIFSVFLCGQSGVGKTEFAKLLSDVMYPNEKQIKLNFGNYSSEGVLNSLIGAPLGYIGSEQGGELINKVAGSESKVILIDEFEKADEKVFNFFYELLEDGKFTDRAGNEHDMNHYIIVFTSNLDKDTFTKAISNPLISRFDMKYSFSPLDIEEKQKFINSYGLKLIEELNENFEKDIRYEVIDENMQSLVELDNLREIKRKLEDIIIKQFF